MRTILSSLGMPGGDKMKSWDDPVSDNPQDRVIVHRPKGLHQYRGFVSRIGLWNPQVQLQITPLCWGVSLGYSRNKIAGTLGPISITIHFPFRGWKAECKRFNPKSERVA